MDVNYNGRPRWVNACIVQRCRKRECHSDLVHYSHSDVAHRSHSLIRYSYSGAVLVLTAALHEIIFFREALGALESLRATGLAL